ncbi:MAG: DUF2721 domain-containing protein [Verrucomicrobiota bacterium]|nr:DUF2721 domain-containing protein [Verrucomicrobiota bacterium]
MIALPSDELIKILQTSISPVVMISGVGLLLLSMTNRFGRAIDRVRTLLAEMPKRPADQQEGIQQQVRVLYLRAQLLRKAITLATCSLFLVGVLIFSLFAAFTVSPVFEGVAATVFIGSILCLIGSLAYFLKDLSLSLTALRQECGRVVE